LTPSQDLIDFAGSGLEHYLRSRDPDADRLAPLYCDANLLKEWLAFINRSDVNLYFRDQATGRMDPNNSDFNFLLEVLMGSLHNKKIEVIRNTRFYQLSDAPQIKPVNNPRPKGRGLPE